MDFIEFVLLFVIDLYFRWSAPPSPVYKKSLMLLGTEMWAPCHGSGTPTDVSCFSNNDCEASAVDSPTL